jgi:hypothetical protein
VIGEIGTERADGGQVQPAEQGVEVDPGLRRGYELPETLTLGIEPTPHATHTREDRGPMLGHDAGLPTGRARGVALAIAPEADPPSAGVNFPEEKLVPAAVVLFILINVIVTVPYAAWCRRADAEHAGAEQ